MHNLLQHLILSCCKKGLNLHLVQVSSDPMLTGFNLLIVNEGGYKEGLSQWSNIVK